MKDTNPNESAHPPRRRRWPLWLVLVLGTLGFGVTAACSSMSKADLATELALLPKNAQMGALQTKTMTADLGEGPAEYELTYYHAGQPQPGQLPIVLIHGTPSTLYAWSEMIHGQSPATAAGDVRGAFRGLAETHEVYALEVIGHGIAAGSEQPYTFEKCARYIAAGLRALGLERVHLVGTSYGGEFVWRVGLNEPDLIESIVLFDASGFERREADWLSEEVEMRENGLADIGWMLNSKERITAALEPHFGTIPPNRVDEFFLVCENKENWKAMIDLAQDENGTRSADLAGLKPRALLVWGANDIAYPPDYYAELFRKAIPNATLVTLPETGHYPFDEHPAEVRQIMLDFFAAE